MREWTSGTRGSDKKWRIIFWLMVAFLVGAIVLGASVNWLTGLLMAVGALVGYGIGRICDGMRHDQHR